MPSTHLISLWIDLNLPCTQWETEGRPGQWTPSERYQQMISRIENMLAEKLQLLPLKIRTLLACKNACQDQQEALSFSKKKKNNQNTQEIKKHLENIARGMGEINQVIMEAHHSICKIGCYNNKE